MMAIAMPLPAAPEASSELDRATLVRCKGQDPIAFRAFVVRYERAVFACLSRMLGRGPQVEDLAQETFLRAFRAFPSFDVDAAARPSTWLLTIATRLALDLRKQKRVDARPLDENDQSRAASGDPERELAQAEIGQAIERAAGELSDEQRAVFVLAEFHDLSHGEIASALGVPENTVKTRLFRARQHLRERLAALRGKEEDHG